MSELLPPTIPRCGDCAHMSGSGWPEDLYRCGLDDGLVTAPDVAPPARCPLRQHGEERCGVCGHTLEEHDRDGWTCDCQVCPWHARSWKARALAAEALVRSRA